MKFIQEGRHAHSGDRKHDLTECNKCSGKAVLFFCKTSFFYKQISVEYAKSKSEINNYRGDDALPADIAHELGLKFFNRDIKILINLQSFAHHISSNSN